MNIPSLDFGLGEDINLLRDAVKAFADAEIAPRAAEVDRINHFPADHSGRSYNCYVHNFYNYRPCCSGNS